MAPTYRAQAVRWEHGWELHVEGVGVTQVVHLDEAPAQIRDYVASMHDVDPTEVSVVIWRAPD